MTRTPERFRPALRVLHWGMAVAVIFQLLTGLWLAHSVSADRSWLLMTHESVGFVILLLVPLRVMLRLTRPVPSLARHMSRLEVIAANAANVALYVLMVALPLTGLAMLSAADYPIVILGARQFPELLAKDLFAYTFFRNAHAWLGLALILTFVAHWAGVLQHAVVRRDRVLSMMALGGAPSEGDRR